MKISIINGSPRPNGATGKILREIQSYLEEKGDVTVQLIDISRLKMKYCIGCIDCYRTGSCVIKDDDIEKISNEIKESDGVVIGSPTYGSNVSGYLKNFMDRGHFIVEQALYGKHGLSVATYQIADGVSTLNVIKKFFLVSGASRSGNILVKSNFNSNPITERKTIKKIHKEAETFYKAIKKQKKKTFFEWFFNDFIVVNTIWKRHFKKHPQQYKGIINHYKKRSIHSRVTA